MKIKNIMKKTYYIFFIIPALYFFASAFVFATAATEEERYDSMQWYFKSRYLYEKRSDVPAAQAAIIKACELDFDNAEAFAYMQILAEKTSMKISDKFKVKPVDYEGKSTSARHWHINGQEAFKRFDYEGALFCFSQAAKNDVTNEQIAYMINL